ncbi:MAG: bifunctional folylpolyglutamate synthase/dihydrofolate synthase [Spirochaetales bacterium]|nr:bifunctional folylpolyglutamate synthase/dihydrofolate synthase [Spirochaetales bacterium]
MSFQDLDSAFAWIEGFTNLERSASLFDARTYQLDRMRALAAASGDPQLACRTVHLAGTKGKGSTAAMIAEGLRHSGVRAGLYTSPHVVSYTERIRVLAPGPASGAEEPLPGLLLAQAEELRELVDGLPQQVLDSYGPPSTFELLTLLAFRTFRAAGCELAVVETGIGGRLDATNLVQPELALITPIELEHTEVLGDTLEAIAREKAGILKPGVPAICAPQAPEAEQVLRRTARERGCPIRFRDEELAALEIQCASDGTRVRLRLADGTEQQLRVAMLGAHQGENAALAYLALRRLGVPPAAIAAGCAAATLPARMEVLRRAPPVVLDGAHTPRSVARAAESFCSLFPQRGVLLFAAAADKKIGEMAAVLAPRFQAIVTTSTGGQRESRPQEVHDRFAALNPNTELVPEPAAALERALERAEAGLPLLITGSFYLAGEARRAWDRRRLAQGRSAHGRPAGRRGMSASPTD